LKAQELGITLGAEHMQAVIDAMTRRLAAVDALDEDEGGMIIRAISAREDRS